jgi:hypothetical protein
MYLQIVEILTGLGFGEPNEFCGLANGKSIPQLVAIGRNFWRHAGTQRASHKCRPAACSICTNPSQLTHHNQR